MTYKAVTGLPVQYSTSDNELASGYYLKFYQANTTIPLSMATDSSGGTLLAQCQISTYGYPLSTAGNDETVFVPHLDQAYRAVLYSKEADATNNIFNNANWNVADLSIVTQNAVAELDDISEVAGLVGDYDNQQKSLLGWLPDTDTDGGILYWSSTDLKSLHDGIKYFSPTVPYTATTADYLNGVGETDPSGTGIWIKSALSAENKQSYTATYSANVYTVTPEINPTIWPTLQAGLIIEFDLSATANTSTVNIDFNGTEDELKWINGDSLVADDLDGDYTARIRCRFDGTDWLIISDVSGSNANGKWVKNSNGNATANGPIASFALGANVIAGSAAITTPITMLDTSYDVVASGRPDTSSDFYGFVYINSGRTTTTFMPIFRNGATAQNVIDGTWSLTGRWY